MIVPPALAWKVVLAVALIGAMVISLYARAPRRRVPPVELRQLVLAAISLYAVGGLASVTHHPMLAALVSASGITVCALAAWLSRGSDSEGPSDGEEPVEPGPSPEPDGVPLFDWGAFERQFRSYSERSGPPGDREPAAVE